MFRELELTNFRQHTALTIQFENGLIALRGAVEQGKTSLLEGIGYAMFGTMALREPLADVVTWGQKESSLKARLVMVINGVTFHLKRSKSGAEITDGVKILATGQSEVKRYVEMLLGASAEVCRNLMMADQQAIRGALSKGPGAAVALIEELANFALIERIVSLVQEKLPVGATSSVEARITMLEQQVAAAVVDDVTPALQLALDQKVQTLGDTVQKLTAARDAYNKAQGPVRDAQAAQATHEAAVRAANAADARKQQAAQTLAAIIVVPGPTAKELDDLRVASEDAGRLGRAIAAKRALDALPEPENEWGGDHQTLQKEIARWQHTRDTHQHSKNTSLQMIASLKAKLITETACGLCGKDLSAVPEVVTKNENTQGLIDLQQQGVDLSDVGLAEANDMLTALNAITAASVTHSRVHQQASEFITLDHSFVPARWTWTGPDVTAAAPANAAQAYADAMARSRAYEQALGRQQQAERDAEAAGEAYEQAMHAVAVAEKPLAAAKATLLEGAAVTQRQFEAEEAHRNAAQAHQIAAQALEQARAVLAERERARAAVATQLEAARAELKGMHFNNALLKALRDARPDIANELWGIVSASVSKYFSDIRGTVSEFSRSSDGFKVNGRNIPGLSGSTLDSLGLAVRLALPTTFLPNARFLMLDEASAACNDEREANMVGVVASAGFDQVIWATHSDAVQAFAQQTIQL